MKIVCYFRCCCQKQLQIRSCFTFMLNYQVYLLPRYDSLFVWSLFIGRPSAKPASGQNLVCWHLTGSSMDEIYFPKTYDTYFFLCNRFYAYFKNTYFDIQINLCRWSIENCKGVSLKINKYSVTSPYITAPFWRRSMRSYKYCGFTRTAVMVFHGMSSFSCFSQNFNVKQRKFNTSLHN